MSAPRRIKTCARSDGIVPRVVADAEERFEAERQRLYQIYLRHYAREASPLIVDIADKLGVELVEALGRLRPSAGWPFRRLSQREKRLVTEKPLRSRTARPTLPHGSRASHDVLATTAFGKMRLGLAGGAFQPFGSVGRLLCVGIPGAIEIYVPKVIPETTSAACVGRRLAEVVEHDLFVRRDYMIREATTDVGNFTVLVVDAPPVALPDAWQAFETRS